MATYDPNSVGIKAPKGGFQEGGWYNGRQYIGGTLGEVGSIHQNSSQQGAGQAVSNEVIAQTNPANVSYIEAQKMQQSPAIPYKSPVSGAQGVVSGLSTEVQNARKALDETLGRRKVENEQKMADLRVKEQSTLDKIGTLSQPFREELEKTERERLFVNENFDSNQKLVNELDTLLTEGNNLIKQQSEVTGLASIRNPRIQNTMNDVAARAGVIQSVISARNGQIGMAFQMIDRTAGAIAQDKNDQINYYNTILDLNRRDILSLDDDSKTIAAEQLGTLKTDVQRANETQDYVKKLMMDPNTAQLMGLAGVTLNDSVEQINSKMTMATTAKDVQNMSNEMAMKGYTPVINPKSTAGLITITDATGNKHYYKKPADPNGSALTLAQKAALVEQGFKVDGVGTVTPGVPAAQVQSAKNVFMQEYSQASQPQFTPTQGVGATYTDELGQRWQFYPQGWVRI